MTATAESKLELLLQPDICVSNAGGWLRQSLVFLTWGAECQSSLVGWPDVVAAKLEAKLGRTHLCLVQRALGGNRGAARRLPWY